jgi:hypothetical protein
MQILAKKQIKAAIAQPMIFLEYSARQNDK